MIKPYLIKYYMVKLDFRPEFLDEILLKCYNSWLNYFEKIVAQSFNRVDMKFTLVGRSGIEAA